MALSASTGFRVYQHGSGEISAPIFITFKIGNTVTLKLGDLVRVNTGGFLVRAASGEVPAGVLQGVVDQNGVPPWTAFWVNNAGVTITNDDTVVTSATNQTRTDNYLQGQIGFDPAGMTLFYNDADAALAATNLFQMFDVANSNQVTVGGSEANGQVQLISIDPDNDGDASKGLFRINENQFSAGVDSATAKVAA